MAFNAKEDAEKLRAAMKGLGTDDKTLCEIIGARNNEQLVEIRKAYKTELDRDLYDDIQGECSGTYEKVLTGLILSRAEYDARCCKDAIKGAGTDEDVLIEHLCHRTNGELEAIQAAYQENYGKQFIDALEGDLSGNTQSFFVTLVKNKRTEPDPTPERLAADAEKLHEAGQGKMGTDEDSFIGVMTLYGPRYLRALNEEYGKKYGDTLRTAVESEMGGTVGKAMVALLQDHDDYYTELISSAVDSAGTNEDRLVRVLVSRRHVLHGIQSKFMAKCGKSLKARIESEVGGDLERVLTNLASHI